MYTIGQISEMFRIPISTLRYYDREGLFPDLVRQNGIRQFGENEVEALRVIECLKVSGLEIKEIRQFMNWVKEGSTSYAQRKQMLESRKAVVEAEMRQLEKTLAMLRFKCWYYETALQDGNEDRIMTMLPDHLPEGIQRLYDLAHNE